MALGILSILFFDKSNSIKFSIPRKLLSTAAVMLFFDRSEKKKKKCNFVIVNLLQSFSHNLPKIFIFGIYQNEFCPMAGTFESTILKTTNCCSPVKIGPITN